MKPKTAYNTSVSLLILLSAVWRSAAGILMGPVTNAVNGHVYYLLTSNTWVGAQIEAVTLGGNLATINDAAEQDWALSTFTTIGTPRAFWIGLNDLGKEGAFTWVSGATSTYSNWWPGEPNNSGPQGESYVHIWGESRELFPLRGYWNDLTEATAIPESPLHGIVEVEPSENLVVNGSFETPSVFTGDRHVAPSAVAPWQTTDDTFEIWFTGDQVRSFQGLQNLEILSRATSATIWQDVPTIPGEDYTLSFHHTPRPGIDSTLTVSIDSQNVATFIENGLALNAFEWKRFKTNFTATASTTRIAFSDTASTAAGTHIDRVEVVRLPFRAELRVSEVELCWETVATRTYQVQDRSSLTTNLWTQLLPPAQGNGQRNCIQDAVPVGEPQRLYRIITIP